MITSLISSAVRLSLAPVKLAGGIAGSLLNGLRGDESADQAPAAPTPPKRKRDGAVARTKTQSKRAGARSGAAAARRKPDPKPLDDVTIARKVESTIFRDIEVDKGKIDVNVAERVVWLRGQVETPDLISELESRAAQVAEVRRVENLLHVPEAPAPGRTETAELQAEEAPTRDDEPKAADPDPDAPGEAPEVSAQPTARA